jgi:hypothetical protein
MAVVQHDFGGNSIHNQLIGVGFRKIGETYEFGSDPDLREKKTVSLAEAAKTLKAIQFSGNYRGMASDQLYESMAACLLDFAGVKYE